MTKVVLNMYNVLIKDFASVGLNRQKNILTIRFFNKKDNREKLAKLGKIIDQIVQEQKIILILDLSNSNMKFSGLRTFFLNELERIDVLDMIIVCKNKFRNTLYNMFNPFSQLTTQVPVQIVSSLEEAIRYTNNNNLLEK